MKSVHVIASMGSGGAENFYLRLVLGLNLSGNTAVAIVPKDSFLSQQLKSRNLPIVEIKMRNNWDLIAKWQIRRAIHKIAPQVVQTYMSRATILTSNIEIPLIARLGGYYKLKYFQHCNYWVGNTSGIVNFLIQSGLPKTRVHFIGNFVEPIFSNDESKSIAFNKVRATIGWSNQSFVIIGMGRFIHKKGFDILIQAFHLLSQEIPQARLLLLGDGDQRGELESLVAKLGLEDKVKFTGWVSSANEFLNASDLLVCPSREEPLGNVILEGWASRIPVVSTRTDGGIELIEENKTGLLVDVGNDRKLAYAILQIFKMDLLDRQKIAQSGFEKVVNQFSQEKIVKDYLRLYQQVVE